MTGITSHLYFSPEFIRSRGHEDITPFSRAVRIMSVDLCILPEMQKKASQAEEDTYRAKLMVLYLLFVLFYLEFNSNLPLVVSDCQSSNTKAMGLFLSVGLEMLLLQLPLY